MAKLFQTNLPEWEKITEIDFTDESIKQYNIDTRDFCCATSNKIFNNKKAEYPFEYEVIKKYLDRFFHTNEVVKEIINRFYLQSGGEGHWRQFNLDTTDEKALYWNAKYLRIYRTEIGLCICNSHNKALKISTLMCNVNQEYLNFIKER